MNTFLTAADAWEFSQNKNNSAQLSEICEYILKAPILVEYHPKLVHMAAIVRPSLCSETLKNRILGSMHKETTQNPKYLTEDQAKFNFHKLNKLCTICGADHLETYCTRKF